MKSKLEILLEDLQLFSENNRIFPPTMAHLIEAKVTEKLCYYSDYEPYWIIEGIIVLNQNIIWYERHTMSVDVEVITPKIRKSIHNRMYNHLLLSKLLKV